MPTPVETTSPSIDALLPPEMARRAEDVGVRKAEMDAASTFTLAILAGAFIGLGAVFSFVTLAGVPAPTGPVRVLAGVTFSLGLVLVVVGGAELFTGNTLIVMAWASGRVSTRRLVRNWAIVFGGNLIGAGALAVLVYAAGTHHGTGGELGRAVVGSASAKLDLGWGQAIARGILCNVLVCLAVWLAQSARTTSDRILAVVPPVSAFVAAGFEHSVANMFIVPWALLIVRRDPGAVPALVEASAGLDWQRFLLGNLLPVTIGNVIGGGVLVGLVYWSVYLRRRSPAQPGS